MMDTAILELYNGEFFDVLNPDTDKVDIGTIAHALSQSCRFGGHVPDFYSVATHSLLVSYLVPEADALDGLMHDATESFLCDIPSPIKKHLPQYYEIEKRLHEALADKFGFRREIPGSVKEADARICITEKIYFFGREGLLSPGWIGLTSRYEPYQAEVFEGLLKKCARYFHDPVSARIAFVKRYEELTS